MAAQLNIPIENVYHLLCYAWGLPDAGLVDAKGLSGNRITDLLANVLKNGLTRLLRQGLDREYIEQQSELTTLRGRINISQTIKRGSLMRGRAVCRYTELDADTPSNRLIKSTLNSIVRDKQLDGDLRKDLIRLRRGLADIADTRSVRSDTYRIQFHRNNQVYRFLVSICRLWLSGDFVSEEDGDSRFSGFEQTDQAMRALFEKFVFNYFRNCVPAVSVTAPKTKWSVPRGYEQQAALLPEMRTDICLRTADTLLVIDTKFTASVRSHWGVERFKEGHLFQLFSYLSNFSRDSQYRHLSLSGMLLYPATSETEDIHLILHDYPFHVCHINLNQPWQAVEAALMSIYESTLPATAGHVVTA